MRYELGRRWSWVYVFLIGFAMFVLRVFLCVKYEISFFWVMHYYGCWNIYTIKIYDKFIFTLWIPIGDCIEVMAASGRVFPPPKVRKNMESSLFLCFHVFLVQSYVSILMAWACTWPQHKVLYGYMLFVKAYFLLIDLGVSFLLSGPAQLSLGHSAFFMRRYACLAGTIN